MTGTTGTCRLMGGAVQVKLLSHSVVRESQKPKLNNGSWLHQRRGRSQSEEGW